MINTKFLQKRARNACFRTQALTTFFLATFILSLLYFLQFELLLLTIFLPIWMVSIGMLIFLILIAVPGWMIGYPLGMLMSIVYSSFCDRKDEINELLKENGLDFYPFNQIGLFVSVPIVFTFIALHNHHFGSVFESTTVGSYLLYSLAFFTTLLVHDIVELLTHSIVLAALPKTITLEEQNG